jgi:uncharacterized glyoxalase superfamily protein PhnB
MASKPIPEGYHTVTAHLAVGDAAQAIEYYTKAFGATERSRVEAPGGKIGRAELEIGDSPIGLRSALGPAFGACLGRLRETARCTSRSTPAG